MERGLKALWVIEIALVTAFISVFVFSRYSDSKLEPLLLDLWFRLRGTIATENDVVLIRVDDKSYKDFGYDSRDVFPRGRFGELLNVLAQARAKAVAFDVLFKEQDPNPQIDADFALAMRSMPVVLAKLKGKDGLLLPRDIFTAQARALGFGLVLGNGGIVRRFRTSDNNYLSLETIRLLRDIPDAKEHEYINYYGPRDSVPGYSISEVLTNPGLAKALEGKLAFVGYTVTVGSTKVPLDISETPYGPMYGVEIHATIAQNLLRNSWLRRWDVQTEWLFVGAVVFLLTGLILSVHFLVGTAFFVVVLGCWAVFSYYLYLNHFYLPGVLTGGAVLFLALVTRLIFSLWATHRSRNEIKKVLSRVVAKPVMAELLKDPSKLSLQGRREILTVMFTDISGFSSLAEKTEDEKLFGLLNRYFSELYPLTQEHGGAVMHFAADSLMVVWGAPLPVNDGPEKAMRTALSLIEKVRTFSQSENTNALNTRVGIHYGECMVGNFGAKDHFTYTAIGDEVNVASRLEALNKLFGTSILVSREVKDRLSSRCELVPFGKIALPGRRSVTEVYGLFPKGVKAAGVESWAQGLECFQKKEWELAKQEFEKSAHLEPCFGKASEFYCQEIETLRLHTPGSGFGGEIALEKDTRRFSISVRPS